MTFEQFMAKADSLVIDKYGISIHDCVDAPWWDTWNDCIRGDDPTDIALLDIVVDVLSDADDLFARMVELADA